MLYLTHNNAYDVVSNDNAYAMVTPIIMKDFEILSNEQFVEKHLKEAEEHNSLPEDFGEIVATKEETKVNVVSQRLWKNRKEFYNI